MSRTYSPVRAFVADRDEHRRERLESALSDVDLVGDLVASSPGQLEEIVVEHAEADRPYYGVLRVEGSADVRTVASLKERLPTPRVFGLGVVDPEADALVHEAYGYGLNACIPDPGAVEELEDRVREATRLVLETVTI